MIIFDGGHFNNFSELAHKVTNIFFGGLGCKIDQFYHIIALEFNFISDFLGDDFSSSEPVEVGDDED
jgi:hypothetical protein